jgi:hypothetical protein
VHAKQATLHAVLQLLLDNKNPTLQAEQAVAVQVAQLEEQAGHELPFK